MVKKLEQVDTTLYVCAICRPAYSHEEWAEKCEDWCEEHNGDSNPEVTQHAVKSKEEHKD